MQIYALWCHPRSMSTAFERVMRERGDLRVLHEPFMYEYYLDAGNAMFADFEPDPEHPRTYTDIREMILSSAESHPVFFKDMAYYIHRHLPQDRAFAARIKHAFLIRDPAASIVSYHKRTPDFSSEEVGLEAQWQLYAALRDMGLDPVVVRAEAVRSDPVAAMAAYWSAVGLPDRPEALIWDRDVPEDWKTVQQWHRDAIESGAIRPVESGRDPEAELTALGEPYVSYAAHHRPFYVALASVADGIAQDRVALHQK